MKRETGMRPSRTLSQVTKRVFLAELGLLTVLGLVFIQIVLPQVANRETMQLITEKQGLVSASLSTHLNAGDWLAAQRFLSIVNANTEKNVSFVVDFSGGVIGGDSLHEKLNSKTMAMLARCAGDGQDCSVLRGKLQLPPLFRTEKVKYLVTKPETYGGNNTAYLITAADSSKYVSSAVRTIFLPLLGILIGVVFFTSLFFYSSLGKNVTTPLRRLTELFERPNLISDEIVLEESRRMPREIREIYANIRRYLSEKEIETAKNLEMQKEILAAKRSEAVAQMTQMLAHDVRKPFSTALMTLSAMSKARNTADVQKLGSNAIPDIERSLKTVNNLIQDVMDISARSNLKPEVVDPSSLLETALTDVFLLYPTANVQVVYELRHTKSLHIERSKVLRVFSNIITNAVQAMEFEGSIRIGSRDIGTSLVEFTLQNNGPSIPAEQLTQIFDSYFTSGKKGGTGLGLAIAHKFVTDHGGTICCESSGEREVKFIFTLPTDESSINSATKSLPIHSSDFVKAARMRQEAEATSVASREDEALAQVVSTLAQQSSRKLRILVVDDEAVYREPLSERLIQVLKPYERFEVLTAATPEAALRAEPVDVAIIDVDLDCHSLNGFDVARQMRDRGDQGFLCIHSNRVLPSDRQTALDYGADHFLPKPMTTASLIELFSRVLSHLKSGSSGVQTSSESLDTQNSSTPATPKFAFIDDTTTTCLIWESEWRLGTLFTFTTPEEFWSRVDSTPGFLDSLNGVFTDFHFGELSKFNGREFAKSLRARKNVPVYLVSIDDHILESFDGAIDGILSKNCPTRAEILSLFPMLEEKPKKPS